MDKMVIPNRARVVAVMLALALAGGLLSLALLAKPSQAQDHGAVSEEVPVDEIIDATDCAGEFIHITGTIHTVNRTRVDEDGTFHGTSHYNFVGVKGVGQTTGDKYVMAGSGAVVHNVVQPGQTVTGDLWFNLLIGQGELPDESGFVRALYVISPEGEIKVESVTFHFDCNPEPEDDAGSGA